MCERVLIGYIDRVCVRVDRVYVLIGYVYHERVSIGFVLIGVSSESVAIPVLPLHEH